MGKLVYLMGKSSTGKDTIYKELRKDARLNLKTVVPYTTRPVRESEREGVEYHFVDENKFNELCQKGLVIEDRSYNTCHGLWRYFTVCDRDLDLESGNYITIGTLESYSKVVAYFGSKKVIPVLIELDDYTRLTRAINREKAQVSPKYEELCRRFLADSSDFSEEKIACANITSESRFVNDSLEKCVEAIKNYIEEAK